MDDIMVRPRYQRHPVPARRKKRTSRDRLTLLQLFVRQAAVAILLLLVIWGVKSVNTPATNFVTDNVRSVLQQNIELSTIFKFFDNTFTNLKNAIAPGAKTGENTGGATDEAATGAAAAKTTDTSDMAGTNSPASAQMGAGSSAAAAAAGNTASADTADAGADVAAAADADAADSVAAAADAAGYYAAADSVAADAPADGDTPSSSVTLSPSTSVLAASMTAPASGGKGVVPSEVGMLAPVSGTVSCAYGEMLDPATGVLKLHKGVDIEGQGSGVKAALDGIVEETGSSPEYGNYIRIRHAGGLVTVYAHCSKLIAKKGAQVRKGDKIAEISDSAASVGIHLHFEVWMDGKAQDPLNYIGIPEP